MRLDRLMECINATVLTPGLRLSAEVDRVCATDRISNILTEATGTTLLVTPLTGPQVLRAAEMLGVPAVCFAGNVESVRSKIAQAPQDAHEIVLLVTPLRLAEARLRAEACLAEGGGPVP